MEHRVVQHDGFSELHLVGALTADDLKGAAAYAPGTGIDRLLVDFTDVVSCTIPPYAMTRLTQQVEAAGIRVAVCAPQAAFFGFNRQVIQLAGLKENESARVFRDREEAVAWLMTE